MKDLIHHILVDRFYKQGLQVLVGILKKYSVSVKDFL